MCELRNYVSVLAVLFTFFFGNLTTYVQSDIPSFYYYSRDDNAFIVERADNTERRILTTYTLSEAYLGQWTIDGDGWSPSGELFTWMARPSEGGGSYASEVFIFNSNTSQLHTLSTEDNEGIASVQWSPTNDVLLITSYDTADVIMPIVSVYDTVEQDYLFRYTSPVIPSSIRSVSWSSDGQFIAVSGQNTLLVISLETTEIINLDAEFTTQSTSLPIWLSDGNLVYTRSEGELVILNVYTQAEQVISIESHSIQKVDWSPDENHALIFATSPDFDTFKLYMLSRANGTIRLVTENVEFSSDAVESHWCSDGQYAYFVTDTGELKIISDFSNVYNLTIDGEIRADSRFAWINEGHLLFTLYNPNNRQSELYQFDTSTQEQRDVSAEILSIPLTSNNFSHQDNLLFMQGLFMNLETYEILDMIPSDELLIDPARTDESIWHPSGQAIFLLSRFNSLYYVKVGNVDTNSVSISSEIALCPLNSKACFGWMPNS